MDTSEAVSSASSLLINAFIFPYLSLLTKYYKLVSVNMVSGLAFYLEMSHRLIS